MPWTEKWEITVIYLNHLLPMQKKIGKMLIIFKSELEILFKSTGKIKHHDVSAWQRDTVLGD